jgi:hypothetical protein
VPVLLDEENEILVLQAAQGRVRQGTEEEHGSVLRQRRVSGQLPHRATRKAGKWWLGSEEQCVENGIMDECPCQARGLRKQEVALSTGMAASFQGNGGATGCKFPAGEGTKQPLGVVGGAVTRRASYRVGQLIVNAVQFLLAPPTAARSDEGGRGVRPPGWERAGGRID